MLKKSVVSGGIFIVLFGYPVIGMVLETYGFLSLFGYVYYYCNLYEVIAGYDQQKLCFRGFIPTIVGFARNIPGLNLIFAIPFINRVS